MNMRIDTGTFLNISALPFERILLIINRNFDVYITTPPFGHPFYITYFNLLFHKPLR